MHNKNKADCNENFRICAEEAIGPLYKWACRDGYITIEFSRVRTGDGGDVRFSSYPQHDECDDTVHGTGILKAHRR